MKFVLVGGLLVSSLLAPLAQRAVASFLESVGSVTIVAINEQEVRGQPDIVTVTTKNRDTLNYWVTIPLENMEDIVTLGFQCEKAADSFRLENFLIDGQKGVTPVDPPITCDVLRWRDN
jgi:hypothetical protein